jgi:hypothetical protein
MSSRLNLLLNAITPRDHLVEVPTVGIVGRLVYFHTLTRMKIGEQ